MNQGLGFGVWCVGFWRTFRVLGMRDWALRFRRSNFSLTFRESGIRLVFYCRTITASTAPNTSKRMCCPTHCASHCAPCQPLLRALPAFSGAFPTFPDSVGGGDLLLKKDISGRDSVYMTLQWLFPVRLSTGRGGTAGFQACPTVLRLLRYCSQTWS